MDIKINADMNSAIDQIADKLGTTAKDILPKYTRLAFIQGVVWTLAGVIFLVSPWVVLHPSGEDLQVFCVWTARVLLSVAGLLTAASNIENILAPEAIAIKNLIHSMRQIDTR